MGTGWEEIEEDMLLERDFSLRKKTYIDIKEYNIQTQEIAELQEKVAELEDEL